MLNIFIIIYLITLFSIVLLTRYAIKEIDTCGYFESLTLIEVIQLTVVAFLPLIHFLLLFMIIGMYIDALEVTGPALLKKILFIKDDRNE